MEEYDAILALGVEDTGLVHAHAQVSLDGVTENDVLRDYSVGLGIKHLAIGFILHGVLQDE